MAQLVNIPAFSPGSQFPSRKALYSARDAYHVKTGYKLVVQNCNKEQVIFVCHQHNAGTPRIKCPLKVRANCGKRSEVWTISPNSALVHMCSIEDHPLPSKKAASIADRLGPRIATEFANLPTAPALVQSYKSTEGKKPSLSTVYRGIQQGRDSVFGTEQDSFSKLDCYLKELVKANPGARSVFEVDEEGRFKRCMFVAPYAANFLMHGLPCIITDMAHFRLTKYSGMTPAIVAKDGNGHILPLSWGACQTENEEEHAHHFRVFKETVCSQNPTIQLHLINAMGDRDKGMDAAGAAELGMMKWSDCITHFTNNIANQFKGCGLAVRLKVKTAASLYTRGEADVLLRELEAENAAIHEYVLKAGLENFFRSYTDHARFDIISNQAIESWNKVTKPFRGLPRLVFFQKVEEKVASIFSKRITQIRGARQADQRLTALVPKVAAAISESLAESNRYEALQIAQNMYRVYIPGAASSWEVDLSDKHGKCSCGGCGSNGSRAFTQWFPSGSSEHILLWILSTLLTCCTVGSNATRCHYMPARLQTLNALTVCHHQ